MSVCPRDLVADDPRARRAALERLGASPDDLDAALVDAVVDCLAAPVKAVQRLAADVLARLPAGGRAAAVARLTAALTAADVHARWGAAYALGRLDVAEPAMITTLVDALGERDGERRWAAAAMLVRCVRVRADLVIPALVAAAGDVDAARRRMALYALRDAAPAHAATRVAALRGLEDAAVGVRLAALAALARIEPATTETCARVLALACGDVAAGVRRAALCALGNVGRGVSAAAEAIAAAEASEDAQWRRAAAIARRRLAE
ncbi:MAG: hypothetical protein IT294_12675 [Deltaproteobacteria bacterium]|nr:hypothetical protein [Deltaproteobacteria bacterium]